MPAALCFPAQRPWHHREAFTAGLERIGFTITTHFAHHPRPGDVLVVWNRMKFEDTIVERWEKLGATIIVTENAYIGGAENGDKLFALARDHHNGAGFWPIGPQVGRFDRFGVRVQNWRSDGDHVLVLDQRGFGPKGVAMPQLWADTTAAALRQSTKRPVRLRRHPGRFKERSPPLEADLANCWAVVTWSSGAAIKAIAAGIPVFAHLRKWIGMPAARFGVDRLEDPFLGDRTPMFEGLAWAQWSASELATGLPFRRLLN